MRDIATILILCLCATVGMARNTHTGAGSKLRKEWFRTKMNDRALPATLRMSYADSLMTISPKPEKAELLLIKAGIAIDNAQYTSASIFLSKADKMISEDSIRQRLQWHLTSGFVNYLTFDYRKAMNHYLKILENDKPDSLIRMDIMAYLNITDILMRMNKFDLAHKYNSKAMEAYKQSTERGIPLKTNLKSKILRSRSSIYIQQHDYENALEDLKTAEKNDTTPEGHALCLLNIGVVYSHLDMYDMAEEHYRRYLSTPWHDENGAICVLNYAADMINANNLEGAISLMSKYYDRIKDFETGILGPSILTVNAKIEEYRGNKDTALRLWEKAYTLNDSILSAQGNIYLNEIMSDFENRERELESGRVLRGSRTKSVIIYGLCGIVVLLGAGGWWLWRRHRRRNQENEELESAIADLDRSHKEEVREAEEELDSKNQQLSTIALHMERIKDTIDYIAQQAGDKHGDKEDRLSNIRGSLKELQMQENVWGMFNTYFEQANRSFFDKLHRICPALTNAELRLCAFILANMTTKEIAMMTNRSIRTVETTRYNLRKKLNMKIPTEEYLRNVAIADDEAIQEMRGMCNCPG